MSSNDAVATIARLGLSQGQVEVYLTLVQRGPNSAKAISEESGIARSEVYRILSSLQKMGLVELELTFPKKFKATPLREAVAILIENKKQNLKQLEIEMGPFIEKFESSQKNSNAKAEYCQIKLFPAKNAFVNRSKELARDTTKIIETIMPVRRILQSIPVYKTTILDAKKRGVEVRLITENVDNKALLMNIEEVYSETKFVSKQLRVGFTVYDKENVLIVNSPGSNFPKCHGLWSNNPSIVEIACAYFDNLWNE